MYRCNFCDIPIYDGFMITHTFRGAQLCICNRCTGDREDLISFLRGMPDITVTNDGDVFNDYDESHGNVYVQSGIDILNSLAKLGYCEVIRED